MKIDNILDTERDLRALVALGLDSETVAGLTATAFELHSADEGRGRHLEATMSRRCADLVHGWVASLNAP